MSKKIEKETSKQIEETIGEKIKKHHIILWLLLFFPIALYKIYKYKIFPKWVNVIITIFFIICFIAIIDTFLNPTRIEDNKIKEEIQETNSNLEEIRIRVDKPIILKFNNKTIAKKNNYGIIN